MNKSNNEYEQTPSQPVPGCSHYKKLLWLQQRRSTGLWVQCDNCNRWRYLPDILDKHEVSQKWTCNMNPDRSIASCSEPEVPIKLHEEEDLIHSEYAAGSVVAARLPGWPWWPAMVDDCPDTEQYYWLDGFSDIPTHYNVVFFDTQEATRAWLAPGQLRNYADAQGLLKQSLKIKTYEERLQAAIEQADEAEVLPLNKRLAKYSFIKKYKGKILTPKKINKNTAKRYREEFKRKFKIDLPDDLSDDLSEFDEDTIVGSVTKQKSYKRRQTINNPSPELNNNEINAMKGHGVHKKENCDNVQQLAIMKDSDANPELKNDTLIKGITVASISQEQRMPSNDFDF